MTKRMSSRMDAVSGARCKSLALLENRVCELSRGVLTQAGLEIVGVILWGNDCPQSNEQVT